LAAPDSVKFAKSFVCQMANLALRKGFLPDVATLLIGSSDPRMDITGAGLVLFLRCEMQRKGFAWNPGWLQQHEVRERVGDCRIVACIGETDWACDGRAALSRSRVFNLDLGRLL
jgi:hypothetical protein